MAAADTPTNRVSNCGRLADESNLIGPVSCVIPVSEVPYLTSHFAVSIYAAVRGDCWGYNSGSIGEVAHRRAKVQVTAPYDKNCLSPKSHILWSRQLFLGSQHSYTMLCTLGEYDL